VKSTGKTAGAATAAAAARTGLLIAALRRSRVRPGSSASRSTPGDPWRAVTVNQPAGQLKPDGELPAPLAALGDRVEVRITPAPDGKGTEIAARTRGEADSEIRPAIRLALREAKSLIETGEVLRVSPQPAGRRTPTPAGKLLDVITRRARAEGVV
jgi:hypothetical protein